MGSTQFLKDGVDVFVWWLSAITFGLGTVAIWRRHPTRADLMRRNRALNSELDASEQGFFARLKLYLATLTNETLGLSDNCRTSLYRVGDDAVSCIGRYSKDVLLDKKGRVHYPLDQGCIGEALTSGRAVMSATCDPEADIDAYVDEMEAVWGMPPEVTRAMNMKSRHMLALALEQNGIRIGVVVVESVDDTELNFQEIERLLNDEERQKLTSFLTAPDSPQIEFAQERDF